jgi:hypothetical protein
MPGKFECVESDATQLLPAGLDLESKTGRIFGTATAEPATYSFLVKLSDPLGRTDVRSISIRVRPNFEDQMKKQGCSAASMLPLILGVFALRRRQKRGVK